MSEKTERELLELAAKAYWGDEIGDVCSIRWLELEQAIGYIHGDNQDHNGDDREFVWNPIEFDGDRYRLAAKLKLVIDFDGEEVRWYPPRPAITPLTFKFAEFGGHELAIVRAAAAIGQAREQDGKVE